VQVLADNGGYVLAEDGPRLYFLRRRILPTWLPFVLGVVALIGVVNAVVLAVTVDVAAGAVLLVLGLAAGAGLAAVLAGRRRAKAAPLDPAAAIVALDLGAGVLLNGAGQALAALGQVRVQRAMQVTSSSKALKVLWPGGSCVVYRGDPFVVRGGGIDVPAVALAERGVSTAEPLR
jgi:hypothetical protein